jgi:outer membrane protein OmpA-like peptidoglycan-associated protein
MPQTKEGQGTAWGAGIGAGLGALTGALVSSHHKGQAALIGAGVGGLLGGAAGNRVGKYMDDQQAELQQKLADQRAVEIQRENNLLRLTFHSDLIFPVNSAVLSPGAVSDLHRVAEVLNEYPQTTIIVAGYTDSTGTEQYNQLLSQRRAEAVKSALLVDGVSSQRVATVGYGEAQPIATNATPEGRQLNRRVVITIAPEQQQQPAAQQAEG